MKHKRLWQVATAVLAMACLAMAGQARAQNVTQGYGTDKALQNGMIVRLKPGDATKVEAVKYTNAADMLGVTVAASDSPVSLTTQDQQQVFVATFGKYQVLVNNQNGVIKAGDFVTISAVDGVGMKASNADQYVLGKALEGFAGLNDADSQATLTDSKGGHRNVGIGRILVDIEVAHNPTYTGDQIAGVPVFLTNIAHSVSNKPITALRLYACLGILVVAFVIAGGVLYAGIRTGMTAIGRNPSAKKSIMRNVLSVILAALIVVMTGLIAVYLLLKL